MKTFHALFAALFALLVSTIAVGCKPRTTGEKIEDKVEDATHETGQGIDRSGERVKDAAN
jgi:hypothetical protein